MMPRSRGLVLLAVLVALTVSALAPAGASAQPTASGWWLVNQSYAPTKPAPGGEVLLIVTAVNGGYAPISAASKITLHDTLPAGIELLPGRNGNPNPTAETGEQATSAGHPKIDFKCETSGLTFSCPLQDNIEGKGKKAVEHKYVILPGESIRIKVRAKVTAEAGATLTNLVGLEGGKTVEEVEGNKIERSVPSNTALPFATEVSETPAPFGIEHYELQPEGENGEPDTQAGSHPFQLSTSFNVTKTHFVGKALGSGAEVDFYGAPALTKNLNFRLPPGLIGNVAHAPQCSGADFNSFLNGGINLCPENTAIGVASVTVLLPKNILGDYTATVPIFNLTPDPGEPARFGFEVQSVPVVLTTSVRTGSDYGVEVHVLYATEAAAVLNSQVIFWGVPGDKRHDSERGWPCLIEGKYVKGVNPEPQCEHENLPNPPALLSMPAVCADAPKSIVTGESWPFTEPDGTEVVRHAEGEFTFRSPITGELAPFTGCEELPFEPSIEVHPDSKSSSTPSGLNVKIGIPQSSTLSAGELAEADIRTTSLKLPIGMTTSGGAANNLEACSAEQIGFTKLGEGLAEQLENDNFTPDAAHCPDAAKVGTVRIDTPLLEEELHGSVYLAKVDTAPFESPLALYITAEAPRFGVKVKLAGRVEIDEATGQLTSVFEHAPPLPFSELELHLFDGGRATQSTPGHCGTYASVGSFEASSSTTAHPIVVTREPTFEITQGPGGGACPAEGALPFGTPVKAGVPNTQGGGFSNFVVTLDRPDGNQALKSIAVHEPAGVAAMLASVEPCPTAVAEAAEPSCPASSKVGVSTAWAGLGDEPVTLGGDVYLTGPYHGAPFGLLAVTNAEKVGPFDLGKIPVLSKITVDPTTAAATIASDPIPQFAPQPGKPGRSTGVPAQIKKLVIDVNRPGFTFNPTNCDAKTIGIETSGYEGGVFSQGVPYQASGCGSLPFKPTISVNVESKYGRTDGTGMKVKLTARPGDANIKLTKLVFPGNVPSRLTTIQKACKVQVFEVNPANCPEGSVIGTAVAHTPVLKSPLTGPAYLVSHANESFPDAVFILQGEGIKLVLDGKTNIKPINSEESITSSTFSTVPDAPVSTFEVNLPRGPHSAFSGYGDLCAKPIKVPTTFGGQNGASIETETKVTVEGCGGVKHETKESELAKLLKKCKSAKKKLRAKCNASAHKQASAVATCKKRTKKGSKKQTKCIAQARRKYALKLR